MEALSVERVARKMVMVHSEDPSFFERRDTLFNRRGVDVFGSMTLEEASRILRQRAPDIFICQGVPSGLHAEDMRRVVRSGIPVVIMAIEGDDPALLAGYEADEDTHVLHPPYDGRLLELSSQLLGVAVRRYLRILVQMKVTDDAGTSFGFSHDLSASGLLVESRVLCPIGQTISVCFMLPNAGRMVSARAEVVREAPCTKPGVRRYGCRFVGLSDEDKGLIAAFVDSNT